MKILENVELSKYSTWGIGGLAKYFVEINGKLDLDELKKFIEDHKDLPIHILGGGSNTLFNSGGFEGIVIAIRNITLHTIIGDKTKDTIEIQDIPSSVAMGYLVNFCIKDGYLGLESAAGLPGTLGGAIRGNAGCFGWEIKDNIVSVTAWNMKTGETKIFSMEECQFTYRSSFFKSNPEWIILGATLKLTRSDSKIVKQKSDEVVALRGTKQPKKVKTCGSVFKNPEGIPNGETTPKSAGWLIENCGLKGTQVGGVRVSEVHANFFENFDPSIATSDDVLELIKICQEKVFEKYNIKLEPEVKVVG